jgi:LysM repeat protein/ABC-type branched-subunit amino acid transport system substrate-binding protein
MKTLITAVISVCLLLGIQHPLSAQQIEKSTKTEYIGGKYYYLHTVQAGQTLSAISRAYETTVDEIMAANAGLTANLKVGQVIKVPSKQQTAPVVNSNIHVVKTGETLSSIASSYKVKLEDIFKLNPGLTPNIRPGQEIKIPKSTNGETTAQIAYTIHVVQAKETLYSIASKYKVTVDELRKSNPGLNETIQIGQQIRVPVKGNEVVTPPKPVDTVPSHECGKTGMLPVYNLSLLLPLYLEKASVIDTADNASSKRFTSLSFIGFYEGFLLGLDSLKQLGFSARVVVKDVVEDSAKVMNVLEDDAVGKSNLIVGPFYSSAFNRVSLWAKPKGIKLVNPFTARSEFVEENQNVYKNIASAQSQAKQCVEYIRKTWTNCNIILVHTEKDVDADLVAAYSKVLAGPDSSMKDYHIVSYNKDGLTGVTKFFAEDKTNVVISFVHGEAFISNYIRNLSDYSFRVPLVVFGLTEWENLGSLETEYLMNINLHMVSTNFVDYSKDNVKNFVLRFRAQYNTEPDDYAFAGYDAAMYYCNALRLYGKDFQKCIEDYHPELLEWNPVFEHNPNCGYENTGIYIYRYEDYKAVNAVEQPKVIIEVNKKTN